MKYDQSNCSLYTNDGRLIKRFNCPLEKEWDHLSLTGNDLIRYCGSCSKDVVDITSFDQTQIIAICTVHPEQCSHLNIAEAKEPIDVERTLSGPSRACIRQAKDDLTVIQTARGTEAINNAITNGYIVDIKPTDVMGAICENSRWVRGSDGRLRYADQYSSEPGEFWSSHPQGFTNSAISAYVIPADLEPGTEVYLTDVIEHIVESTHHSKYRLKNGTGTWNGKTVIVHEPKVRHLIG